MTNYLELSWPLLLGTFWQSYSLSFYLMIAIFWVKPYADNYDWKGGRKSDTPSLKMPYVQKFIIGIFGLAGAFGIAEIVGTVSRQSPGADVAFVVGFPVGISVALLMRKGLRL